MSKNLAIKIKKYILSFEDDTLVAFEKDNDILIIDEGKLIWLQLSEKPKRKLSKKIVSAGAIYSYCPDFETFHEFFKSYLTADEVKRRNILQ